jgi:hypothetical protein
MGLQAIITQTNGVKIVIYNGEQMPAENALLTLQERAEVDAAQYTPPPIPASVSMLQARLVLLQRGLAATVKQAIGALPAAQREVVEATWEFSAVVRRDSAVMLALAAAMGWDDAWLDALFVEAATL